MSSIEKRLRDELGELASWLIDKRAESSSVGQAVSGSDSIPKLDLDADTVRPGGRSRLFRVAAALLLIVGIVSVGRLLSEDPPPVVTVPTDPATQTPTTSAPPTTTVDGTATEDVDDSTGAPLTATEDVDDSATADDQLDESSGEQIVSEVELDLPLRGPFEGPVFGEWHRAPELFPWGAGFLQIGFLNTGEDFPAEINLFAQISGDGLNWEQPFKLNLPQQHFNSIRANYGSLVRVSWPFIESNGEHLVVLSRSSDQNLGDGETGDELSGGSGSVPVSEHFEQRVFVSVTDDLEDWDNYEHTLQLSDGIHESLTVDIVEEDLIVSKNGWMFQISTSTYMDVHSLVSANIQGYSRWIRREEANEDGLIVELEVKDPNSEYVVSYERLFSWEELGTTLDLYKEHGLLSNKAVPISRRSGSVLVAEWGEGAILAGLPSVADICCQIVATDAGYVGLSVILPSGVSPIPSRPGDLVYSPDGVTWHVMESPADEGIKKPNCVSSMWTPSIHAVEGGVVLHGREQHGTSSEDCEFSLLGRDLIWVGDDRGSNWKLQEISEGSFHKAEVPRGTTGRGVLLASVIPIPRGDDYEHLYQGTIVSSDGINWVTFGEETDPVPTSVAFNGNVALRIDGAGNAYRYELP